MTEHPRTPGAGRPRLQATGSPGRSHHPRRRRGERRTEAPGAHGVGADPGTGPTVADAEIRAVDEP